MTPRCAVCRAPRTGAWVLCRRCGRSYTRVVAVAPRDVVDGAWTLRRRRVGVRLRREGTPQRP